MKNPIAWTIDQEGERIRLSYTWMAKNVWAQDGRKACLVPITRVRPAAWVLAKQIMADEIVRSSTEECSKIQTMYRMREGRDREYKTSGSFLRLTLRRENPDEAELVEELTKAQRGPKLSHKPRKRK